MLLILLFTFLGCFLAAAAAPFEAEDQNATFNLITSVTSNPHFHSYLLPHSLTHVQRLQFPLILQGTLLNHIRSVVMKALDIPVCFGCWASVWDVTGWWRILKSLRSLDSDLMRLSCCLWHRRLQGLWLIFSDVKPLFQSNIWKGTSEWIFGSSLGLFSSARLQEEGRRGGGEEGRRGGGERIINTEKLTQGDSHIKLLHLRRT